MYKIVQMALKYHEKDPGFKDIVSNRTKSFLYRVFGPFYVKLTLTGFKAIVDRELAGYILLKEREFSFHVWDVVVAPEWRGKGIGKRLMEYAEEWAKNNYHYASLAVLEDNTIAMGLYQKLGYENFRFSPIYFHVENFNSRSDRESDDSVAFHPVFGKEAIRCRENFYLKVLTRVIGQAKSEVVNRIYPSSTKLHKNVSYFRIMASKEEVGYLAYRTQKGVASVSLLIDPEVWDTATEKKIILKALENYCLEKNQLIIVVLQAYEEQLTSIFRKISCKVERETPRLALIKELG